MIKKILPYALIVIGISVILYVYFQLRHDVVEKGDAFDVIPANSSLVLDIANFDQSDIYFQWLKEVTSNHKDNLLMKNPMQEWSHLLGSLDSLQDVSEIWHELLNGNHVIFASTIQGESDEWIMSIALSQNGKSESHLTMMREWLGNDQRRTFKDFDIHEFGNYQYAEINRCLVLASKNSILEDVILRNQNKESILRSSNFMKARDVADGDSPMHIFISMDNDNWLQLDPVFTAESRTMSGYAILENNTSSSFILSNDGAKSKVAGHLPWNTSLVDIYAYKNFESGWAQHQNFAPNKESGPFFEAMLHDYADTCQCPLNDLLFSWRSGESGNAIIPLSDSTNAEIVFIGIRDSMDVVGLLGPLLADQKAADNHIYQLRFPQLFERNLSHSFLVETNYLCVVDDFVFLASTPTDLMPLLKVDSTLAQNKNYIGALKIASPLSARFLYQTAYYVSPLPQGLVHILGSQPFIAAGCEHFKDNKYLVNIALPFEHTLSASINSKSEIVSKETNEIGILKGPWQVINHTDNSKEKIWQDNNFLLFLSDQEGNIFWQKKLASEVLGDIVQIDALANGKLQYAFTTVTGLHIVDRNGNYRKNFPVIIKSGVTTPLHVADYDKNKEYRLLFADRSNHLYNYSVGGIGTVGWKPPQNLTDVVFINDLKIGDENFVMTVNQQGEINFLKRTGVLQYKSAKKLADYDGGKCWAVPGATIEDTKIKYYNRRQIVDSVMVGQ